MSSTQRPPFCPPPLPGTEEDYPAPRRTNVVPLRHVQAEAGQVSLPDENEPAWCRAFVLGDGTRTTRTPNRIMRPTDSQDDKPSIGADLTAVAPPDDESASLVVEPPSTADAIDATVRSQIAELRATFASAAPDVAERLAALAVKESALSSRGSRILADDSPQRFSPPEADPCRSG